MRLLIGSLIAAALMQFPIVASAQSLVFKCVDSSGNISYLSKKQNGDSCEVTGTTLPDRWKFLTWGTDHSVSVFIDTQSIAKTSGKITAWVQYVYYKNPNWVPQKGYEYRVLQREAIQCAAMKSAIESFASYDENESSVQSGSYLSDTYSPVIPDTIEESVWEFLCSHKGKQ